jgi:outer membrane lipoprotein
MKRIFSHITVTAVLAASVVTGCAPPFTKALLDKADKNLLFSELNKAPEKYIGKIMMLGGTIVDTKNLKDRSQIEVLQKPLDGEGRPAQTDETGGRFLIVTSQFVDGAVYHRGRSVTIIGEVAGSKVQPLGESMYRYPVLTAKELHLWPPSSGPHFSIGIGVYRGF